MDMSAEDIDALFARTLVGDNLDDEQAWEAVHQLRSIGSRDVFERAAAWCRSANPLMRARGADVLAQLGCSIDPARRKDFADESFPLLVSLIQSEKDLRPINSAIFAFGHLHDSRAIPLIVGYHAYPSADIRFAVAVALGSFANDPSAIATLMALMEDADDDVRDWATFGLGVQGEADTPEIRDALVRRLSDANEDARQEAVMGLAKRGDERVLPALIALLEQETCTQGAVDAACLMLNVADDPERDGRSYAAALRDRFQL
jgi:HEAT repeat protein